MRILILLAALSLGVQESRASYILQTTDNTVTFTGISGPRGNVLVNLVLQVRGSFDPELGPASITSTVEVNEHFLGSYAGIPGTCHAGIDCPLNNIAYLLYYGFAPNQHVSIELDISNFTLNTFGYVSGPGATLTAEFDTVDSRSNLYPLNFTLSEGNLGGVPEPSTWAMLLIGFAALGFAGYRRQALHECV
jgi:hypothetical protein